MCVCLGLAAGAFAAPAFAHFDQTSKYTYKGCPGTQANRVDPLNVVFTTWGTWGRAVSQTVSHAGWMDTSGSTQYFVDHGSCYPMHAERASGTFTRFHIRIRGQHWDDALG